MSTEASGKSVFDSSHPIEVEYRDLVYKVPSRSEADGVFHILRRLNGICRNGRMQALMGPSGAGKTSLLDVLAGNVYGGRVEGQILVNHVEIPAKSMSEISCYVMQHPILLSSATVRESLMTSALLRLPQTIGLKEKERLVQDIMEELGLAECANVLVGNEQQDIKGLSGGQIRRLAIGVELVTKPRVIVLDEPTSGLDSEIAVTIMQTLKALAQKQRTVVCSIHQPNSDIVDTFDDFHLMDHGKTVYQGAWSEAVNFFAAAGFQCPTYKNPTDYFMTVLKETENAEKLIAHYAANNQTLKLESGSTAAAPMLLTSTLKENSASRSDRSWRLQFSVLWIRFIRTWMRNPILFWSEFTQYAFTAIFVGLMYLQVDNDINFGTFDRYASQFFILAAMMFVPSYSALLLWDTERKLLKVETNRRSYGILPYFLAKTATSWPMEILMSLVLSLIVYWMIGYQSGTDKFFIFFLTLALFQMISESLGLLCACVTTKSQYAVILLSMSMLVIMSFTGFIVRDIPVYFEWVQKVAYVAYATAALAKSEFDGIQFRLPNGNLVEGSSLFTDKHFENELLESTREELEVINNGLSVSENLWVLFGLLMGLRLLCYFAFIMAARFRFL